MTRSGLDFDEFTAHHQVACSVLLPTIKVSPQPRFTVPAFKGDLGQSIHIGRSTSSSPATLLQARPDSTDRLDTLAATLAERVCPSFQLGPVPSPRPVTPPLYAGKGNSSVDLPNLGANASNSIADDQRNRMRSLLSGAQSNSGLSPAATFGSHPQGSASPSVPASAGSAISPIPRSAAAFPPPKVQDITRTQEIEQSQKLQEEQGQQIDQLNSVLGPYSPSGKVPGLWDSNNADYFPDDFDLFLDSNAYHTDGPTNDFDFGTGANDAVHFDPLNDPPPTHDFGGGGLNHGSRIMETNTPGLVLMEPRRLLART
ncbi:heat shock transcription factor [Apiospora kogelbergensis]|uniref:Heat shock transcription factor n=1 Tax=Apiospora kogelbergensis TaxID=1337665 RepID=A0AAW0QZK1_9PEZI